MPTPIFRRVSDAVCSLVALCTAAIAWSQIPVLEPAQVIEAPADPGPVENFNHVGWHVELEGNRLLIGTSSHIARLFEVDAQGQWNQGSIMMLPDGPYRLANFVLFGNTAVVLAYNSTNQERILGRLYVFRENAPQWTLVQTIELPSNGLPDWLSGSVDFDGKTIAVGAGFNNSVYVYRQDQTETFALTATIQEPSAERLGASVAIKGNTLMAGAPGGQAGGSVYVYRRVEKIWQLSQELKASDGEASDGFGSVISLKGGRLAISAENADQSEQQYWDRGAVYVFGKTNGQWSEEQKIDRAARGSFGAATAIDGRRLVISAPNIVADDSATWHATAYAYEYRHGAWSLLGELAGPTQPSDSFAADLALDGTRLITTDPDVSTPDPLFDGQAYEYDLQRSN